MATSFDHTGLTIRDDDATFFKDSSFLDSVNVSLSDSWTIGGIVSAHVDKNSSSFVQERLVSELIGSLVTDTADGTTAVSDIIEKAFLSTDENRWQALQLCQGELQALQFELAELENTDTRNILPDAQKLFLKERSISTEAMLKRFTDYVTLCLFLLRNKTELFIASLGDFYAYKITRSTNAKGYDIEPLVKPHDFLNPLENGRLKSLNLPSDTWNKLYKILPKMPFNKTLPLFTRCFSALSRKDDFLGVLTAVPTVVGPVTMEREGFIAVLNTNLHDVLEKNLGEISSVGDLLARKFAGHIRETAFSKSKIVETFLNNINKFAMERPISLSIRWFPVVDTLQPIEIDTNANFVLSHVPEIPKPVAKPPKIADCVKSKERCQPYVNLIPFHGKDEKTAIDIDASFHKLATEKLTEDELKLLGLK